MTPIAGRLASALKRKDEGPNIVLAEEIVETKDAGAVDALVHILQRGATAARHDAIKVL